jgi:hypothetical protein
LLGLGRRKLIPSREQVACSEPSVTPILSAICSRLDQVFDLLEPLRRELDRSSVGSRERYHGPVSF